MYDESRPQKVKTFIERYLKHSKGKYAGKPFILQDWQQNKIIKPLYGTVDKENNRQYRTCLVMVARKNGKTTLAAGLALYHLFADKEMGGEVYSAAVDKDQASLVFNEAANMVRQSPFLSARCKIIDSQKRIVFYRTNSFYRAIAADAASAHGYNASCVIYDELHALDIYNGCPLWKVSLPQSFITKNRLQEHFTGRRNASNNYIATSDILYVFQESSCLLIDPVTGKQIGEITTSVKQKNINGENFLKWHEARVWDDYLLVNVGSYLVSMDRHTGNIQWKVKTQKNRYNFAVGNGKVFAADYWLPNRRKKITEKESKIQAFDIKTGDLLWDMSVTLSKEEDINNIKEYVVHPIDPYLIYSEKQDIIILLNGYHVMGAYTGTGGKQLWRSDDIRIPRGFPPVVLSDKFITRSGESYDLLTGNIIEKKLWGDLRGCNSIIGNQESIFMRDGVPMVYRLDSGFQNLFLSSRSGCTNNLIPGDGVLCVLNFAVGCACNYPVFTSFGSAHMQDMKN